MMENENISQAKKYMIKLPVQKRSRETVASIKESATRLLVTVPYHDITTDKIAEMAGVSIGSLYQFFANKEAIISAVMDDLIERDLTFVRAGLRQIPSFQNHVGAVIDLVVAMFQTELPLRMALQHAQGVLSHYEARRLFTEQYQLALMDLLPEIPGRNKHVVAHVVVSTFLAAMNVFLMQPNNQAHAADLKRELGIMFERYLRPEN